MNFEVIRVFLFIFSIRLYETTLFINYDILLLFYIVIITINVLLLFSEYCQFHYCPDYFDI